MQHGVLGVIIAFTSVAFLATPTWADWSFNGSPNPNVFIQTSNMTLELQCDRIRFAPAGFEESQDIADKQGLSIRFMKDGATDVGAFQAGSTRRAAGSPASESSGNAPAAGSSSRGDSVATASSISRDMAMPVVVEVSSRNRSSGVVCIVMRRPSWPRIKRAARARPAVVFATVSWSSGNTEK